MLFASISTDIMDDDGLRNWGFYDPLPRGNLGLHLMSPMVDPRDTKPFLPTRDNAIMMQQHPYHHPNPRDYMVSEAPPMNYMRESWMHREKISQMHPVSHNLSVFHEPPATHSMQILQPLDSSKPVEDNAGMGIEDHPAVRKGGGGPKQKRTGGAAPKAPKAKKPRKGPSIPKENGNSSVQRAKPAKKNMDVKINGIDMDISGIPIPVCSCTGTPQQCYRWGCGGWQSACCTTTISMYPLPMSTKRRGARIAGRKMSQGAFKKVLEKLAAEGYNFANAIDLRSHWAKHGTNKFVTIR